MERTKRKNVFRAELIIFLAVIAVSLLVLWIRWENSHATYKNYDIVVKKNVYCEKTQTGRVDLQIRRKGGKKAAYFRQTDGGTDADPQQSGAAGGDVRSSGQRSIFHGKCNARKGGRQGDNRTAGGSRQSHGGRITGIASGITYSIAENVRRPKEFRKHSPDL